MDYLLYILIFFSGILFGNCVYLAIYKIPLKKNKTYTHSYCPECNHVQKIWDLIPFFSYVFLRGRCRYCKKRLKPTSFLIEILTGVIFVLFSASIKLSIYSTNISVLIYFMVGILYISILLAIIGIDKKYERIDKIALILGFVCVTAYLIYLYISEQPVDISLYRYIVYLIIACFLVLFSVIYLKKKGKDSYTIDILTMSMFLVLYTYESVYIYTVMITLIAIALQLILHHIIKRKRNSKYVKGIKVENTKIPIGFYMGIANLTALIITNFTIFYI